MMYRQKNIMVKINAYYYPKKKQRTNNYFSVDVEGWRKMGRPKFEEAEKQSN